MARRGRDSKKVSSRRRNDVDRQTIEIVVDGELVSVDVCVFASQTTAPGSLHT